LLLLLLLMLVLVLLLMLVVAGNRALLRRWILARAPRVAKVRTRKWSA
jgi:hypothetical protein